MQSDIVWYTSHAKNIHKLQAWAIDRDSFVI
jgi:hypothetical protein